MATNAQAFRLDADGNALHIQPAWGPQFTALELQFFLTGRSNKVQMHGFLPDVAVLYSDDAEEVYSCPINATASAAAGRPVYGPALSVPLHMLPTEAPDRLRNLD